MNINGTIWTSERTLFKQVTEATSLIAWATDELGHCFYLSPAWYHLTGTALQSGPDLDWLALIREDEREIIGKAFEMATARRIAFGMPYWLQLRGGGYTRVWDVGLPKFDDDHQFRGFFGTVCPLDQSLSEPLSRHEAPNLSTREREVLRLVADGNTTETIAAMLGISGRTVDMHVTNAMGKLGAFNRVHAVSTAIRRNEL
jgi:DNA-binding CsgD family transcriptional regulator